MMEQTHIYALVDPRTDAVRYIGKTKDPKERLKRHLIESKNETNYKANWVKSLLALGLKPTMEILDTVPAKEWRFWECYYMDLYRTWGFKLTNLVSGGNGADWVSPETRIKLGLKSIGREPPNKGKHYVTEEMAIIEIDFYGPVAEWPSATIAAKELGLDVSSICKVLNGKNRSTQGFNFITQKDFQEGRIPWIENRQAKSLPLFHVRDMERLTKEARESNRKPILQYDMKGNFIKEWSSIREAANGVGRHENSLHYCLIDPENRKCAGFKWKFKTV